MTDSISELQAERKRTEREPRDWATMRAALIESGMVEEARERRESYEGHDEGVRIAWPSLMPPVAEVPLEVSRRTLVDELFEEKHRD